MTCFQKHYNLHNYITCLSVLFTIVIIFSSTSASASPRSFDNKIMESINIADLVEPVKKVTVSFNAGKSTIVYSFDENGCLRCLNLSNTITGGSMQITDNFDDKERLISDAWHQDISPFSITEFSVNYSYDDKNKTFQRTMTERGKTNITATGRLDSVGRPIEKIAFSLNNNSTKTTTEYNSSGQLIKETTDDAVGSPLSMVQKLYNLDGRLSTKLYYRTQKNGLLELFSKENYFYDHSRLIKAVKLEVPSKITESTIYEYLSEDNHHNWTKMKKSITTASGTKTEISERRIEY